MSWLLTSYLLPVMTVRSVGKKENWLTLNGKPNSGSQATRLKATRLDFMLSSAALPSSALTQLALQGRLVPRLEEPWQQSRAKFPVGMSPESLIKITPLLYPWFIFYEVKHQKRPGWKKWGHSGSRQLLQEPKIADTHPPLSKSLQIPRGQKNMFKSTENFAHSRQP